MSEDILQKQSTHGGPLRYLSPFIAVAVVTIGLTPFREGIDSTVTSLIFLLAVLFIATFFGKVPALITSFTAALCFNFFFLPPYYTLTIAEPQNWVALIVFLIVALTVGHLSATARRRARVAEELYQQLQDAFEKTSQAEALRRSEALKSALLDAITHDLRTPLTSIKAASTMLLDEQAKDAIHRTLDPERSTDLLMVINEETDRLNTFVESMVELANIESGQVHWRRRATKPGEIVSNALDRLAGMTKGHRLAVKGGTDLPELNVEPKAIAEVIYNLVDNAVKYSPQGSLISINAERSNGSVRFCVEDEAERIPADERENVFRKFYRIGQRSKGFGVGLAIVKGIVEAHGGRVWVEEGQKGNRFAFDLPLERKDV